MDIVSFVLVLLAAVLASAALARVIPRVSLPLVQMGVGLLVAIAFGGQLTSPIDSELFLVLLIAPLLFDESRRVDKRQLVGNLGGVLSLAIGLVVATTLVVGLALHALVPAVPLAAAFALGAALGPTDATAVASLSGSMRLSDRQRALLSGESLVNDASGIVAFQFAVAAAATGVFSVVDATGAFAVSFFGGLGFGLACGVGALLLAGGVRALGLVTPAFHVTFEIVVPFATFMAAERLGVSGVLAVVAAGLVMTFGPRIRTAEVARVDVVSSGVWETLSFALNGIVFVLLGMQLPFAFSPSYAGQVAPGALVGLVLVLTAALVGVRFAWVFAMEALRTRRAGAEGSGSGRAMRDVARDALVTTLLGPKGAITLSIAFTLPLAVADGSAFPMRDELVFLASGVILCTLLLATFAAPALGARNGADARPQRSLDEVRAGVVRMTIETLKASAGAGGGAALSIVLRQYEARLALLEDRMPTPEQRRKRRAERRQARRLARADRRAREPVPPGRPAEGERPSFEERAELSREIELRRNELEAEALRLELDAISDLRAQGTVTREEAQTLRSEVYLMQLSAAEQGEE